MSSKEDTPKISKELAFFILLFLTLILLVNQVNLTANVFSEQLPPLESMEPATAEEFWRQVVDELALHPTQVIELNNQLLKQLQQDGGNSLLLKVSFFATNSEGKKGRTVEFESSTEKTSKQGGLSLLVQPEHLQSLIVSAENTASKYVDLEPKDRLLLSQLCKCVINAESQLHVFLKVTTLFYPRISALKGGSTFAEYKFLIVPKNSDTTTNQIFTFSLTSARDGVALFREPTFQEVVRNPWRVMTPEQYRQGTLEWRIVALVQSYVDFRAPSLIANR